MNLEQLQSMSDKELNELSALKVMGWELSKYAHEKEVWAVIPKLKEKTEKYIGTIWNPVNDMNDAMELINKLHTDMWEMNLYLDHKITTPWDCRLFLNDGFNKEKRVISHEKTAPRAITIASILAKESE